MYDSELHQGQITGLKSDANISDKVSNPKYNSLSDVSDVYDVDNKHKQNIINSNQDRFASYNVNEDKEIINKSNSVQEQLYTKNESNDFPDFYPKYQVEKINNLESVSYTSYRSDRPDRIGPLHRKYPRSDIWACDNCSLTDDIHFMEKHPCKNNKIREKK